MRISPVLGANQLQEMAVFTLNAVEQPEGGRKTNSKRATRSVTDALTTGGVKVGVVAQNADSSGHLHTRSLKK